ncbi:MAG TPA: hypothetical protein VGS19_23295 [Streptosporangiaceae bacterium]|nr:hypothetical protein [Streptosporangiaceae bacterium]
MPEVLPLRPGNPRRVGRYRLTGRVDELATPEEVESEIFLARSVSGDMVVVTLLSEDRASDAAARDRFTAEARAARRVPPFCAARILDSGFEGNRPYLVSEFIPGPSLAEVIQDMGALPRETVRSLAIGCATGLAAIHQAGLVHGHMRPEMVVLSAQGPRVVQFSITPPYGNATPAADMFAWAQTVLAAAGQAPTWPPNMAALDVLPDDVRVVVSDCLAPEPSDRLSARRVLAELLSNGDVAAGMLAEGSRVARAAARMNRPSDQDQQGPPIPRDRRPQTLLWGAAAAACLVALVGAVTVVTAIAAGHHGTPTPITDTASQGHGSGPQRIPKIFAGDYTGTIHQTKPDLTATVQLALTGGKETGSVNYPGLGCSGQVSVLSVQATTLTLKQKITKGNRCADGAITLTTQPGGLVKFSFSETGGTTPVGNLTHQSGLATFGGQPPD